MIHIAILILGDFRFSVIDKTVFVTGATSGIGMATALGLAEKGFKVIIGARNQEKAESVKSLIQSKTGNLEIQIALADLSKYDHIERMLYEIEDNNDQIDVLINNAALVPRKRIMTPDGIEMQLMVNHLAPFILTNRLIPLLKDQGRIVNVSGDLYKIGKINFDDLSANKGYGISGWGQYSNTLLMNHLFTFELARKLKDTKITANCLHPGVIRTSLGRDTWMFKLMKIFFTSPKRGANTGVYLASSEEVNGISGKYFIKNRIKTVSGDAIDGPMAKRFWEVSEELINEKFGNILLT